MHVRLYPTRWQSQFWQKTQLFQWSLTRCSEFVYSESEISCAKDLIAHLSMATMFALKKRMLLVCFDDSLHFLAHFFDSWRHLRIWNQIYHRQRFAHCAKQNSSRHYFLNRVLCGTGPQPIRTTTLLYFFVAMLALIIQSWQLSSSLRSPVQRCFSVCSRL